MPREPAESLVSEYLLEVMKRDWQIFDDILF